MTGREQGGEGISVVDRLRHRKVVQWGIAYAAGAWGFQQGFAYLSTLLEWPARLQKLSGLALLIGLPIAVVLAWYHGDKGEQRLSRTEFAILTVLFLIGGGLFWRYERTAPVASTSSTSASTIATDSSPDNRPSIAVLPFENRSDLEKDAFFVDGIHDDIITQLSKVSALRVISRTSVERFRNTDLSVREIAQQLGVKSILEGGVQRAGDRVRINVQLIDADADTHHWAETYDRELTAANIFAIQSEVASAIAAALRTTLTPAEQARAQLVPTQNIEAWEAYQLGRQRMARRRSESLNDAEAFFRKALDLDSSFALAYVGLADALKLQVDHSGAPVGRLVEADKAVSTALMLDPTLAEAWTSKAGIAMSQGQGEIVERMLRKAIELNPNYAQAHHWLSVIIRGLGGDHGEELKHAERAVQLDPLAIITLNNFAESLAFSGQFDEAAKYFRRSIDVDPGSPLAYGSLAGLDAYARNRFPEAVAVQERGVALDPGSPGGYAALVKMYFDIGDMPKVNQLVASMTERWPTGRLSNVAASIIAEWQGNLAAARLHASRSLAANPLSMSALTILRNADLRKGNPRSALARYASAYPELSTSSPRVNTANYPVAIDLALVLQKVGELERASALLDAAESVIRSLPRLGLLGYGLADAQIHALNGRKLDALVALRAAERAGWRGPYWRYYRDIEATLASIRNEPEFKAVFADIERDMAKQRATLAARPKDAPLDLGEARK